MTTRSPWSRVDKKKLAERFAIEVGPALVFVVGLQAAGINVATVAFVVATGGAALYSWFEKRHFPLIPFGMVALAALFGALTIAFDDPDFIKFRATFANVCGSLALLAGLFQGRLYLKTTLQDGFKLTDGAWWVLTLRMSLYLFLMGVANEVMRDLFSTEIWAWFKTVSPLFNLVFLWLNWPLIRENLEAEPDATLTDEPPAGPRTALDPTADALRA